MDHMSGGARAGKIAGLRLPARLIPVFLVSWCLGGYSVSAAAGDEPQAGKYFQIRVVDEQTGRGVPLIELSTTNNARYYTDSNGVVAFYEPGLMDTDVHFLVKGHGYEYPKDGFGYAGKTLAVTPGGSAELKVKRINIAERLYRITGTGIYRDSVLLGLPVPLEKPVINGLVCGSDSVLNTVYQGRLWWIWGDTGRPAYPLGNFNASGATSRLPADGGLDPDVGVNLTYFVDAKGFAKGMAPVPGEGPTWLDSLLALPDDTGRERLLAGYAKVRQNMETYERGFVEFDDDKQEFVKIAQFDKDAPACPGGHPVRAATDDGEYLYFGKPVLLTRVRADRQHFLDVAACESYTCLKEGTRAADQQIDRAADGTIRYGWKKNTPFLGPREQADLVKAEVLKPEEALLQVQDADTGKAVQIHGGSTYWNRYRNRWVLIATELFGTSVLGELWYAEADTPVGPWVYARKVITHDAYSFYNPNQHPQFAKDNDRIVYFEGTYTILFSGNPTPTPFYEYNQIMYKLDLADARLTLPVPVYDISEAGAGRRFATCGGVPKDATDLPIAFFACDRAAPGTVPVYANANGLALGDPAAGAAQAPVCYVLPAESTVESVTTVPLYEYVGADGQHAYSTAAEWSRPGYQRAGEVFCRVWRNPFAAAVRFAPGAVRAR